MKIVIMAGGKGTRIATVNSEVPKPMIMINGKTVLEYTMENIAKQGYTEFVLVVGHLGHVITEYFGDGSQFGVSIRYVKEDMPLGTAGALFYLKDELTEDFLLVNGDIIFDINIERMYQYHKKHGKMATILTHPNSHPYDSGIIIADENGCVQKWLHKEDTRTWYRNRVNAGIHMLSPTIFQLENGLLFGEDKKLDLDRDVLKAMILQGELYVYDSPEYVKDMGTPERLQTVALDIRKGVVQAKNWKNKQKAVFLDRDGTINRYVGFLRDINQFELIPGVEEAIKNWNASGYLVIVITNQPVIARGEVTVEELQVIHNKMETLLGEKGAYIDAIYYCPHHPNKGFVGEVKTLKKKCDCRKPKPGMILKAARDYNIDLSQSYMIGDSENDVLAGEAAGCKAILCKDMTLESVYNKFFK